MQEDIFSFYFYSNLVSNLTIKSFKTIKSNALLMYLQKRKTDLHFSNSSNMTKI